MILDSDDFRRPGDAMIDAVRPVFRNPIESFSVDVELTSFATGGKTDTSRFRVYGKSSDRSVVEFTFPQTEKGKYLLMLRDAMWIYLPTASRPIRISPLQRLMGQASNGDVARTSFTVDYSATAVADDARDDAAANRLRRPELLRNYTGWNDLRELGRHWTIPFES